MTEISVVLDVRPGQDNLRGLCASWEDVQRTRLALAQRGMDGPSGEMAKIELALGRRVQRELRRHAIWPWLEQYPGLRGVHVARLIALIGDPHRFPGQRCTAGHYMRSTMSMGNQCPTLGLDGPCGGTMLPPRPGSGVRSLWHWAGLHVVNGRSPRKAKGQRIDWSPVARTCVLMPGGIADQIVRSNVKPYVDTYRAEKVRLTETRAAGDAAIDIRSGPQEGMEAEVPGVIDECPDLRPFQVDAIARKIAAKKFLGDLLMALKGVSG